MSIGRVFPNNTSLAACISMMAAVVSSAQGLDSVMDRASNYVVDYEQELGTVSTANSCSTRSEELSHDTTR